MKNKRKKGNKKQKIVEKNNPEENLDVSIANSEPAKKEEEKVEIPLIEKKKRKARTKKNKEEQLEEEIHNLINDVDMTKTKTQKRKNAIQPNESPQEISMDDRPKTIFELMNDTKSGIPMANETKKRVKKKKAESDNSETFSIINSEISGHRVDKHFLRNKTNREEPSESPNFAKFFKPTVKWCPISNKMIIEKPTIQEAALKMQEEIMKSENVVLHENSEVRLTSSSFRKTLHTEKWTRDDTEFFYKALECFGTDFSFLEIVLKPRNRSQIKNKFRKEEKDNLVLVEAALKRHDPKKLIKILNVFKEFREEMALKNSKKIRDNKKVQPKKRDFDFKKLIMANDLVTDESNIEEIIKELVSKERQSDEENEDMEEEEEGHGEVKSTKKEDEGEKTISVIYESEEEDLQGKNHNFQFRNYNKKVQQIKTSSNNSHITSNSAIKTSNLQVIIKEESNVNKHKQNENKEANSEEFCFEFLKNFNS